MKIGTSLGKCVKSILDGTVKEQDVLFIVTNTRCPDLAALSAVIEEYHGSDDYKHNADYDMSAYTLQDAQSVATLLFTAGKIHQPRVVSQNIWVVSQNIGVIIGRAHYLHDTWYDIVPTNTSSTPAVVEAYNHYQMLSALTK